MNPGNPAGPAPDPAGARGGPTTVLVIEDDPVNLELDLALLEEERVTVLAATSAEEGLRLARAERPSLILLDMRLPGLSGWAAAVQLKADPATARIPIVALTAQAMPGDEARARAAGCEGYLAKPVDTNLFRSMIRRFLAEGRAR